MTQKEIEDIIQYAFSSESPYMNWIEGAASEILNKLSTRKQKHITGLQKFAHWIDSDYEDHKNIRQKIDELLDEEQAQKPLCKVDPSFLCDELTAKPAPPVCKGRERG